MTNVVKLPETPTPPTLLQQAIAGNASIETIEKLLVAQEKWEAMQARKAFNNAIAAFKANAPTILKTSTVSFGDTSYKHEDLAEMMSIVDPALASHGLWARWKIHSGDKITVTCLIGHADGHSEEAASLSAPPDTSGKKNPIQSIGSTVSYLQRYTIKAALGLAAARDDDGRAAGRPVNVISEEQADELTKVMLELKDPRYMAKLLELAGAPSISDIQANKYNSALGWAKKKAEEQKAKK